MGIACLNYQYQQTLPDRRGTPVNSLTMQQSVSQPLSNKEQLAIHTRICGHGAGDAYASRVVIQIFMLNELIV